MAIRSSIFIPLAAVVLLTSCAGGESGSEDQVVELDVTTKEILVFGDDESAPPEALLGGPRYVRTDSDGNIYVSERKPLGVKVYNDAGNYLRTIGSEGEGPGEFRDITSMTINNREELVVADWHGQRMLRFSPDGEVLATRTLEREKIMWPRYIRQFPGGDYLMLYRLTESARQNSEQTRPAHLIHIFNEQLEKKTSFGTVANLWEDERPYAVKMSGFQPGNVTMLGRDELIYAPPLYKGKLYRFRHEDEGWARVQTLEGHVMQSEAYTLLEEEPERENQPPNVSVIYSRGDVFPAAIHNKSEAVFTLSDGRIIHFSVIQEGEERYLQAELFTEEGQLTGWGRIDDFDNVEENNPKAQPPVRIAWKDEEDRFYIVDYRGHPTVRVVNVTFASRSSDNE